MSVSPARFLFKNGVVLPTADTPPITTLLETHSGAYTTTRTHNNGESILFYDRHISRLSNSLQILLNSNPRLVFGPHFSGPFFSPPLMDWASSIRRRLNGTVRNAIQVATKGRSPGEELAISTLIGGNGEEFCGRVDEEMIERVLDMYVHIGMYLPPVFGENGARLAVVGKRRDFAQAKYSDWARMRKPLEALRPPAATELLLSDNGDQILEGTITNFFVVCFKENSDVNETISYEDGSLHSYELQTAPVNDGVLPGVIRQLVIEICFSKGIAVREVSPSWSDRGSWEEAFITNSLRLVQHVETIQAPSSWASLQSKSWEELLWVEKQFKASPGMITTVIQKEIMKKADVEGLCLY